MTKYLELNWDADANAEFYNVYGSLFVPDFDEAPDGAITAVDSMPSLPSLANYSGTVRLRLSRDLPVASGGDGVLVYSITSGALSLVSRSIQSTRVLSGTPDRRCYLHSNISC